MCLTVTVIVFVVQNRSSQDTVLWKTVHSKVLERGDLVHIASVLDHQWPVLAWCLGVSETTIATIRQNYALDHEEQKFQMMLRWFQDQSTPPTGQGLVRIIEEHLKDVTLAQDVVNILGRCSV